MGEVYRRIYYWLNRDRLDRELAADMEAHREMMSQGNRTDFGNDLLIREKAREAWGWTWLERLMQDARYGFRTLRKDPGFTLAAVMALALGIGANTALFSVVYGVLLKPLPYAQDKDLVVLQQEFPKANVKNVGFSVKELQDYRASTQSLSELEEYHQMSFILLDGQEPADVRTGVVSAHFFDLLGIKPYLGRFFTDADDTPGNEATLVLSYEYWKGHYGGDPSIIGRHFRMNDKVHTVIGVMPPVPQYPRESDVYMTTIACPFRSSDRVKANRNARMLQVFGRLKPNLDLTGGKNDVAITASRILQQYPGDYPATRGLAASMYGLKARLTAQARPMLLVLLATSGLVLLIACANVANLALSRIMRREQELALRSALGASRTRVLRQLLTESTMLSLAGGALGLLLASGSVQLLKKFVAKFTVRAGEISISTEVLLFTLGLSLLTGLIFGCIPAFSMRMNLVNSLKDAGNATTERGSRNRLRSVLVAAQVAVSFILLIGAGLMVRSFIKLQRVNAGYNSDHILTATVPFNFSKYTTQKDINLFFDRLFPKLEVLPGVQAVAANSGAPLAPGSPSNTDFVIEGRSTQQEKPAVADVNVASADTFKVLGVPLISGRVFDARDNANAPKVAIISKSLAERFFPNQDPMARRLSIDNGQTWNSIVGVVGDVKYYGLDKDVLDGIYFPFQQGGFGNSILLKVSGDPTSYERQLRDAVLSVDPEQPVRDVKTLDELRGDTLVQTKLTTLLLALFAGVALAIAATGLSGVTALMVSQRTKEIGIRLALGAQNSNVLRMVLNDSVKVVAIGVAAGIVGALAASGLVRALLFETPSSDPITYVGVAFTFLAVGIIASYIPARRVTEVDPLIALRNK